MKRFTEKFMACMMAIVLMLGVYSIPAFASESSKAEVKYVLSFRPGANGHFSDSTSSYLASLGRTEVSSATGNVFVEVSDGTVLPGDIESALRSGIVADDGYYYRSGFDIGGTVVTSDETYVAEYGVLKGSGTEYTVRYLDKDTNTEIAESITAFANSGDQITFTAKTISDYKVDDSTKTITVGSEKTLDFIYTGTATGKNTTTVSTVTSYVEQGTNETSNSSASSSESSNSQSSSSQAASESSAADNSSGSSSSGGEVINDNSVPLDNGSSTGSGETISDNEVPLSNGNNNQNLLMIIAIVATGIVIASIIVFIITKKKSSKS